MLDMMFYGIKLQHRVIAVSCCTFRYSNPPSNAQMEIKRLVPFDDEGLSLAPTLSIPALLFYESSAYNGSNAVARRDHEVRGKA